MMLKGAVVYLIILFLAMLALSTFSRGAGRYTLITKARLKNGDWLVEPIYNPILTLRPLTAVAKGTVQGEALRCGAGVEGDRVILTCEDNARFELVGFMFQE